MNKEKIEQIINNHHCEASSLIQILLDIQNEFHWLSPEALELVGEKFKYP